MRALVGPFCILLFLSLLFFLGYAARIQIEKLVRPTLLTDDARGLEGMWEYHLQEELPEYPPESTALEFHDDGTCRCFVTRFAYNFSPDGELMSYSTGGEDVEGRFNVIDGRLKVWLPANFSEYPPNGTITNREASSFHVETDSGKIYVFKRIADSYDELKRHQGPLSMPLDE